MNVKDFEHMALPPPCTPRKLYNVVKAFPMIKFDFASIETSNDGTRFSIHGELKVLKFQVHILYVSHDYSNPGWGRYARQTNPFIRAELPMGFSALPFKRDVKFTTGVTGNSPKYTMEEIIRWVINKHQSGVQNERLNSEEAVRAEKRMEVDKE